MLRIWLKIAHFYKQRLSLVSLNCSAVSTNYLNILLHNTLQIVTLFEITLLLVCAPLASECVVCLLFKDTHSIFWSYFSSRIFIEFVQYLYEIHLIGQDISNTAVQNISSILIHTSGCFITKCYSFKAYYSTFEWTLIQIIMLNRSLEHYGYLIVY